MLEALMQQLDALVALTTLAVTAKSFYSGTLGRMVEYVEQIPNIQHRLQKIEDGQDELCDRQSSMADAAVALAVGQNNQGESVDPDTVYEALHDNGTPRDYLSDTGDDSERERADDD